MKKSALRLSVFSISCIISAVLVRSILLSGPDWSHYWLDVLLTGSVLTPIIGLMHKRLFDWAVGLLYLWAGAVIPYLFMIYFLVHQPRE